MMMGEAGRMLDGLQKISGQPMNDVLLQVAAFPNLLQTWPGLEKRFLTVVWRSFAWRAGWALLALPTVATFADGCLLVSV